MYVTTSNEKMMSVSLIVVIMSDTSDSQIERYIGEDSLVICFHFNYFHSNFFLIYLLYVINFTFFL